MSPPINAIEDLSKVDLKSVFRLIPLISTAYAYKPYFMTNSSLQTIAAAAPSLVGQHCSLVNG
jgi:hypothetical protein